MKLLERVLDSMIREMVSIDDMQFGFVPGRGTTDAAFIVRQLQEKHLSANKILYLAFVDLEKAFDRVPRKVLWWAMRYLGVEEWAVRAVQAMYEGAKSCVRVNGQYSEQFSVKVGVHQGAVLSPLLFIMVLEALSREFRTGAPWELLYADDLVIIADSLEELLEKLKPWKAGMEAKGLRVNMGKTKLMVSGHGLDVLKDSGTYPCAVCRTGVGANSILCTECKLWVHKKCSGIKRTLGPDPSYRCLRCRGLARPIDGRPLESVDVDGSKLDVVPEFCYLGDMLSSGGGCTDAIAVRCRSAWKKFRELLPIFTTKHVSLKAKGKLFSTVVRKVMLHGGESWAPTASDIQRLRRNDRSMIRWICGVKARDEIPSTVLHARLGVAEVDNELRTRRLRWYGHVQRSTSHINTVTTLRVNGPGRRGRPKKSWEQCVKKDVKDCMKEKDPCDRVAWRAGVRASRLVPTSEAETTGPA